VRTHTKKHSKSPSLHYYGVTRGWLPQRTGPRSQNTASTCQQHLNEWHDN